ncbi:MAG: hypothetical protein U5J62_04375 [Desulfurivibrio sp.]|nr:hypothetical protein [Desulfurivibrio sp.]
MSAPARLLQREVGGDGAPFGLQMIFGTMSAAIHRGDPIDLLDLDPVIERLRADINDPNFIKELVRTNLLDNPHRVRLTLKPDPDHSRRERDRERARLDATATALTNSGKEQLIERAAALQQRQETVDDISVLPRVGIDDVGVGRNIPLPDDSSCCGDAVLRRYKAGTGGLVYHQVASRLPSMDQDLLELLPVYSSVLTSSGSGGEGYLDTQHRQHSVTGGINA